MLSHPLPSSSVARSVLSLSLSLSLSPSSGCVSPPQSKRSQVNRSPVSCSGQVMMGMLAASSSSKVFVGNRTEPCLPSSWPWDFHTIPNKKRASHLRFLNKFVASGHGAIHPSSSQSSFLPPNCQANLDTAGAALIPDLYSDETQTVPAVPDSDETQNVRVRFKLQKECLFGERFLIVGDDPTFGIWDLSCAIPMDWSDGHVWSVEMDVPVGKSIHFKFILEERTGKIFWQPGPDRFFQTRKMKNTVTVIEDWENPELQQIVEEEPNPIQNATHSQKESINYKPMTETGSELLSVAEKVSPSQEKPMAMVAENTTDSDKPIAIQNIGTVLDENISRINNGRAAGLKNVEIAVERQVTQEAGLVLVPGLSTKSMALNEAPSEKDEKITLPNASISADVAESHDNVGKRKNDQLDEKQPDSFQQQEMAEMSCNGAIQHGNKLKDQDALVGEQERNDLKPSTQNVLQNDINWGRKTLHHVLTILGLI